MDKKVFELDFYGRKIVVEHGQVAKQADGAVLVRYGDTVVLSTAVVSKSANLLSDFFPLMVLYQEKLYSVGKIPGGFIKREGRPTDAATLAARMIDRPLRPLFPEDFKNEVQIVNTVLSVDQDNSPELTALLGSSLCVSISKIPFNGPVAAVKVGRINGEFIINPTVEQAEESDIDLTVAGTRDAINMVEAGAREASEDDMLEALMFGHEAIKKLIAFEEEVIKEIGVPTMEYEKLEITSELRSEVDTYVRERLDKALRIKDKLEKYARIDEIKESVVEKYTSEDLDWTNKSSRSMVEMEDVNSRPGIVKKVDNLGNYKKVIVGFPVWWYREPSIIDTFMEENNFDGKSVYVFVTSGGSTVEGSFNSLKNKYNNVNSFSFFLYQYCIM